IAWETRSGQFDERWLGTCTACRRLTTVILAAGRVSVVDDDPLKAFLEDRPALGGSPPWVRVFLASSRPPWNQKWRHRPEPCGRCAASVRFVIRRDPG